MNPACPRRVSLIPALGLPAIPSPTIGAMSGVRPAARRFGSPPIARFAGFVFHSKTRPSSPTVSSSRRPPLKAVCVTDWSFSPRCSPPRIAATQLRFDTARLFAAQKRTSTVLSHRPLRRTSPGILAGGWGRGRVAGRPQRERAYPANGSVSREQRSQRSKDQAGITEVIFARSLGVSTPQRFVTDLRPLIDGFGHDLGGTSPAPDFDLNGGAGLRPGGRDVAQSNARI